MPEEVVGSGRVRDEGEGETFLLYIQFSHFSTLSRTLCGPTAPGKYSLTQTSSALTREPLQWRRNVLCCVAYGLLAKGSHAATCTAVSETFRNSIQVSVSRFGISL
jgi:hypothetical protein